MDSLTSSFTPPCVTQPPPCGHLLPKEGGIDTLKTPHILAPSSGRGENVGRSETGLAPPYVGNAFPHIAIPTTFGHRLYKNRHEASHLGLQRRFLDFARNDDTTRTPRLSTRRSCYFKTYFTTSYASLSFGAPKARDGLSFSASSSFSRPSRPSVRSS